MEKTAVVVPGVTPSESGEGTCDKVQAGEALAAKERPSGFAKLAASLPSIPTPQQR